MGAASMTACAVAAGLSMGSASQARAQTSGGAPVTTVDELIVTATKRNESVRDVAMPISAVSGADLQKANANSLADYITRLPGVTFNDYQPGISEVVVRGISATTYHEQGQTTTGYYLNEVVLVEPGFPIGIPDIDTFDLERVEVLRGPQGTLFGSSTLGGLVNYVAKTANVSAYEGAVSGLLGTTKNAGDDANYAIKGMVNIPIVTDKLGVRLVGLQRYDAGYLDNPGTGVDGANDFRTRGLRGSAVLIPAEGTKLTFLSTYQDTQLDDQTYLSHDYVRDTPLAEPQKTSFWLNSLRLDQDVGFADLTAIGSTDHKTNTTVYSYPYPYVTGVTSGDDSAYSNGTAKADLDTFEVRLSSKADDKLKWLIGASYMKAKKSSTDRIYQPGAGAYITAHPADFGGYPGSVLAPGDAIYGYISDTENEDFGVFGELSYKFTPQWEITLGGRYYDTKNTATITNAPGSLGAGSYSATASTFGTEQKEDGFTPKVTLAYRPAKGVTAYATYSRGFRVGGPNPNAAILPGIPESYESDTVDNYEAGLKTGLFEDRLLLDVSVFHMDWKNIQARLFTAAPYYYSYVTNAGGAKVDGVEFSGTFKVSQHVTFSNNTTYQEAKLSSLLPDSFAAGGGYAKGTTLPGSSKWSTANTLSFDFPEQPLAPSFQIAQRYLSKAPVAFGNPNTRGDFTIIDLRASISPTPTVRILGFVNNFTNEYGILNAPFTSQAAPAFSVVRPRTAGVRVDWSF
jgi:outer membrane receptor protein involved in Fe transport